MRANFIYQVSAVLLLSQSVFAQWTTSGNNAYNTNSGNIGIGNASPTHKLDVTGTVRATDFISGNQYISVLNNGSYRVAMNGQSHGYLSGRNSSNVEKFLINSNGNSYLAGGNFGIGQTTPLAPLDVYLGAGDAAAGTGAIRIGGTGNYPSLEFGVKGAYDGMISTYGNDLHIYAGNWRSNGVNATENHNISFYTSRLGSNDWNTAKMFLRYDGSLGIGTTAPNGQLQVNQTRPIIIKNNGGNAVYGSEIGFNAVLDTYSTPAKFKKLSGTAQQGGAVVAVDNWGTMTFQMYNGNTNSESVIDYNPQVVFTNGGHVGIGTTSPDEKLTVKGKIHTSEVRVDLQPNVAPDYVFEKNYDLLPLPELESYINTNKHLPEVPSAKEMEANGLNLKEMNLILLKKVEELTLHLIYIKKENQSQAAQLSEVDTLKTEIASLRAQLADLQNELKK